MVMAVWDESEHPRDDEGKFTYKNWGVSSGPSNVDYKTEKGILTGGAAGILQTADNLTPEFMKGPFYNLGIEHIDIPLIKQQVAKEYGLETAENLLMSKPNSYLNTEYAKQFHIYNSYNDLSDDLQNYFKNKIVQQIGEENLNSTKGIFIDAQSDSSKDLAKVLVKESGFKKIYEQSKTKMKNNLEVEGSLNFEDTNFYNALGSVDIKQMKYRKNGDVELLVTDVYDFNKNSKSKIVQAGRKLQEKGKIKPYFIMYHVIIPKNSLKDMK